MERGGGFNSLSTTRIPLHVEEEGRERGGERERKGWSEGISRFARIWGRILNAFNWKTVRALFAGIVPGVGESGVIINQSLKNSSH